MSSLLALLFSRLCTVLVEYAPELSRVLTESLIGTVTAKVEATKLTSLTQVLSLKAWFKTEKPSVSGLVGDIGRAIGNAEVTAHANNLRAGLGLAETVDFTVLSAVGRELFHVRGDRIMDASLEPVTSRNMNSVASPAWIAESNARVRIGARVVTVKTLKNENHGATDEGKAEKIARKVRRAQANGRKVRAVDESTGTVITAKVETSQ